MLLSDQFEVHQNPVVGRHGIARRCPSDCTIEIVESTADLQRLGPEWHDLCARSRSHTLFQRFEWIAGWWDHVGDCADYRQCIVTVRDAKKLRLVWPLVLERRPYGRILRWHGAGVSDYCDVILDPTFAGTDVLDLAWRAVAAAHGVDVVLLDNVRRDAAVRPFLDANFGGPRRTDAAPFVACSEWPDWSAYNAARSRNLRKDQRRRRRRLAEQGDVVIARPDSPDALDRLLDWVFHHKLAWLRHVAAPRSALISADVQAFVRHVVSLAFARGTLYAIALELDGQPIAAEVGFIEGGRMYSWIGAFDLNMSRFSPGRMLLEESLSWCFSNGIDVFDFVAGTEAYKYDWASGDVPIHTYMLARSWRGRAYGQWLTGPLRSQAKKLFQDAPMGLRRRVSALSLTATDPAPRKPPAPGPER